MSFDSNRRYQIDDIPWFLANPKSFMLYDPRMGKTVVSSVVMAKDEKTTCVLIVCSKNAMGVWLQHIEEIFPGQTNRTFEIRLVRGNGGKAKEQRKALWLKPRTAAITIYICTYAVMQNDSPLLWLPSTLKSGLKFDTVIADEVHIRMKNRKNGTVAAIKQFVNMPWCHRYHALSGTMASKGGPLDFWANLNVIAPRVFTSYWQFASRFMEIIDGTFGKEIIGPRDLPGWYTVLDRYSRRRFRHIEAPNIPRIQRALVKVDLNKQQIRLYDSLLESGFAWSGETLIVAANSLEATLRFRQIMACPAMLDPSLGVGEAFEHLVERLTDDDVTPEDRHTVVFTEFAKALPFYRQRLIEAGFEPSSVQLLQGGLEPEELNARIKAFRHTKGIIICTIKYAQAFSLEPATESHFIGYSWDPNENKQAEDRLLPQEGVNPILANYYCYRDTYDETLAETMNIKNKFISVTIGSHKDNTQEINQ